MLKYFPNNRKFSWKSQKEQKWNTKITRSASGRTRTLTNQLYPEWIINASYPGLTDEEARELLGFVALVKGSFEPFYWLDPEDYLVNNIKLQEVSTGVYQCVMMQGNYIEPVEHVDNLKVFLNGSFVAPHLYKCENGYIKFSTGQVGTLTASYRYYWKVQFADDGISIEKIYDNINKAQIKLRVVR